MDPATLGFLVVLAVTPLSSFVDPVASPRRLIARAVGASSPPLDFLSSAEPSVGSGLKPSVELLDPSPESSAPYLALWSALLTWMVML